jgi:hypothetical protein
MMNDKIPVVMIILLVAGTLASGCLDHQTRETPEPPCGGQEPIIGDWFYDPGGMGDAVFLFIFKEYGRFDAVAVPRDASVELAYEVWITGTWQKAGEGLYGVAGQIIRHDFETDTHETFSYAENLTYDSARDMLVNRDHPRGLFTRISCEPQIPHGMNVSIPFD